MSKLNEYVTRYNVQAGFYGWKRIELDNDADRVLLASYILTDIEDPNMHNGRSAEQVAAHREYLWDALNELEAWVDLFVN